MKALRKKLLLFLCIFMMALTLLFIFVFRDWLFVKPFRPFEMTEITGASLDKDGNLYVIDKTGERVLKADPDGVLLWQLNSSSAQFSKAEYICTDDYGRVYVKNTRVKSGIRLDCEEILRYSPDGKYEKKVFSREAAKGQIRHSIIGLYSAGDEAGVIISRKDGISVRETVSCKSEFFPLETADILVLNAALDKDTHTLWYLTTNGRIYRYVDGKDDYLLYDNSLHVEGFESVPRNISYRDGIVYASDRGLRCPVAIDDSTGSAELLDEGVPWEEREVCESVTSEYVPVSVTQSFVKIWDSDKCETLSSFTLSAKQKLITICLWVSLAVLSVCIVILLILFLLFLLKRASTMVRIVTAILAGVGTLAAMLIGTLLPNFSEQLLASKFDQAHFCASLVMERMPIDAFLELDDSSDYLGSDYIAVQSAVDSVFKTDSKAADDLYCTMYRVMGDHDTITLTYSLDENSMLFPYDWEYEDSEEQAILTSGSGREYVNRSVEGSYLFVLDPILDKDGNAVGLIEVGTDLQSFESENRKLFINLLLNLVAITAVSVMILTEFIYFIRGRREYSECRKKHAQSAILPAGILRMIVFVVFFFTNLTTAILPVHAMKLAAKARLPWVSSEIMAALPLSAEVVAGAVFSVLGVEMIRRMSVKRASLLCAMLFSGGLAMRIIPNFWIMTAGSCVIGIGWGVILLMVNTLIADMPGAKKDTGFAYYNAAALNGINSGTVFGGFLLNWVPYTVLFAITAAGSLVLLLLVYRYLIHSRTEGAQTEEDEQSSMTITGFMRSPNILIFFLMLVVPVLTGSYFLIYLYPIIGVRWGLGETYVGYSYLLNGLCVMALSATMTNLFTRLRKKRLGLALSAILYGAAFVIVAAFRSIPALLIALIILGFSDSFGLPLQTSFYTDLEEVRHFGIDRSLGVYSLFENVSQALGPFVFSLVLVTGISRGLTIAAGCISILAVVFFFAGAVRRKR